MPDVQLRHRSPRRNVRDRRGAIVVLTAFLLVIFMAMMAFAIDIGYMNLWRSDLQHAADAGVLAGAAIIPEGDAAAEALAREYVARNMPAALDDYETDVVTGYWDRATHSFVPGGSPTDSIEVTVRRKEVPLFFGPMMGHKTFDTGASAVASFRPRDIMLVLDFSGSMNSQRKIQELKSAVDLFFNIIKDSGEIDQVAFVRYATDAQMVVGLTKDYDYVNSQIQDTKADGWTNIGDGLNFGRQELENNGRQLALKMLVIMTDGKVNRPADRDPRQYVLDQAQLCADGNIQIVAISFGSDADKSLMQSVTDLTSGTFFDVDNGVANREDDLRAVFEKIATMRPVVLVD